MSISRIFTDLLIFYRLPTRDPNFYRLPTWGPPLSYPPVMHLSQDLYIGTTLAIFKAEGKTPSLRDRFIMWVRGAHMLPMIVLFTTAGILSGPGALFFQP